MTTECFRVENVHYGFKGHLVFDGISLAVANGERVAIMGPSGSGKTTLLKIIAGFRGYEPTAGLCHRYGRMAMVFQQPLLLNYLNVISNIELPSRIQKRPQPTDEIVRILGLQKLLKRYPFQLSGGQQRRVALARALAFPQAAGMLLDEAFSGLDEPLRDRILVELEAGLEATDLTCVFSTHSPYEAAFLADRVVLLDGSPAAIVAEHSVSLPRGQRYKLPEQASFFEETTAIRRLLSGHASSITGAQDE